MREGDIKLCKDCKYWRPSPHTENTGSPRDNLDYCDHPSLQHSVAKFEPIRGTTVVEKKTVFCQLARESFGGCTPSAILFEERTEPHHQPNETTQTKPSGVWNNILKWFEEDK